MPGLSMRTSDPDEAAAAGGDVYFPHRLEVRYDRRSFGMSLSAVHLGPVSAGLLGYTGEVVLQTGELETGYQVNVPMTGYLRTWVGTTEVTATPDRAAVYPPDRPARLHGWSDGGALFGMKIDRTALERYLADLTDRPVRGPVRFAESMDLARGPGRQWWALARSLAELAGDPDGPLSRPMVARPLAYALVGALVEAADHPGRDALAAGPAATCPAAVARAVDLLEAEPATPWTVPEVAARAGLSVRALQHGFDRHLGHSPTAHLRRVRLARAHDDLLAADPARATVAGVAARWGFTHLGRFAAAYRRRYGRSPSEDLRAGR